MSKLLSLKEKTQVNALVAFTDLTLYLKTCQSMEDHEVASWMDEFFNLVTSHVEKWGGLIVKFIGDAALIVFEEELADQGVRCLLQLKEDVDHWLIEKSYKSRMAVQVHFGPLIAGPFGPKGNFDLLGKTVNTAATLQAKPFAISTQAFRQLSPESRKRFKKHTPPVTYIRTSDPHPR